ncbi:Zinc finger protein CONSTANS-LIKE [Dionaea muscipula]
MEYLCDFCAEQRPMVYCRSDAACLCLSCDRNVHSANALSKRHSRTLVCERCYSQPAFVRCLEGNISLCQNCDWMGSGVSMCSSPKRQPISSYTGCPSSTELSTIWTFIADLPLPVDDFTCDHGVDFLSIKERTTSTLLGTSKKNNAVEASATVGRHEARNNSNSSPWTEYPSIPELGVPGSQEQRGFSGNGVSSKMESLFPGSRAVGTFEDDTYVDLDMDEIDINFENYEELFGVTLTHCGQLLENGGIDSLFRSKDMSTTDSNCKGVLGFEGSSVVAASALQRTCSNAASADSVMSIKTEPAIGYGARQAAHSNLIFSALTGDTTSVADYQDGGGASSMLLLGDPLGVLHVPRVPSHL